jgi:protein-S-isoprenylcysteine O-methyltransferase Ste14
MLASGVGIVLLVPNAAAAISFAALFIGLEIHVRFVEEPHLLQIHGAAYSDYASRVGRFLPFVGRGLSRRLG